MRITVLLWAVGLALWGFGRLDSGGPLVLAAEPEAFDPKATMPQRAAQPKAQELQKAEKLVEEVFGRQIAKAKTPQEKQQLAQEILTTAREEQDSVLRYATLQAARRLAVDALDGKLGLEIVREMVAGYDPLEAMSVKDRLAEADRLWQQAERAQGREKLAKQLEAVEQWLYCGITSGLAAKKWKERIDTLGSNECIILSAKDAKVYGQQLRFDPDPKHNAICHWHIPTDYIEWEATLAGKHYAVELIYASRGNAGGYLMGILVIPKGAQKPTAILDIELPSTGGWENYLSKSIGNVVIRKEGVYTIRLVALRKLKNDFDPALINVRALILK